MAAKSTTVRSKRSSDGSAYVEAITDIHKLMLPFMTDKLPLSGQDVKHCKQILRTMKLYSRPYVIAQMDESDAVRVVIEGTKALKIIVQHMASFGFGDVNALKFILSELRIIAEKTPEIRGQLQKGGLDDMLRDLCKSELKGLDPEELEVLNWTSHEDRIGQKLETMRVLAQRQNAKAQAMLADLKDNSEKVAIAFDDEKKQEVTQVPEYTPAAPETKKSATEETETMIKKFPDGKGGFVEEKVEYKVLTKEEIAAQTALFEHQPYAPFETRGRRAQGAVQPKAKGIKAVKALFKKKK